MPGVDRLGKILVHVVDDGGAGQPEQRRDREQLRVVEVVDLRLITNSGAKDVPHRERHAGDSAAPRGHEVHRATGDRRIWRLGADEDDLEAGVRERPALLDGDSRIVGRMDRAEVSDLDGSHPTRGAS